MEPKHSGLEEDVPNFKAGFSGSRLVFGGKLVLFSTHDFWLVLCHRYYSFRGKAIKPVPPPMWQSKVENWGSGNKNPKMWPSSRVTVWEVQEPSLSHQKIEMSLQGTNNISLGKRWIILFRRRKERDETQLQITRPYNLAANDVSNWFPSNFSTATSSI